MRIYPAHFILSFLCPLFTVGCSVYAPRLADVPLISKQGELRLDGSATLIPSTNGTVSYGLTNHLALQAHGSATLLAKAVNTYHRNYHYQGAVGYYRNLKNRFVFETYLGGAKGFGHAYASYLGGSGQLENNYQQHFAQFSLGRVNAKFLYADYGVSLKLGRMDSRLDYSSFSGGQPFNKEPYSQHDAFIEPQVFVRLSGKRLKANIKVGSTYIAFPENTNRRFPYYNYNFGFGLNYRIDI